MPTFDQIYKDTVKTIARAVDDTIELSFYNHPLTTLASDVIGFGRDGGAMNDQIREDIFYTDNNGVKRRIFRSYDEEKGERQVSYGDLVFDGNGVISGLKSGRLVKSPKFDSYFETMGSASRLTNGDYLDVGDKTGLRNLFVESDVRYNERKKRRTIAGPVGSRPVEVVEIPYGKGFFGGFFRVFDLRSYDFGRMAYRALGTLIYKMFDDTIFDPLIENTIDKINEVAKKTPFLKKPIIPKEAFIEAEFKAVNALTDSFFRVPPEMEYAMG